MNKQIYYTYLGTNGSITTNIHLEDVYYVRKIKLVADENMLLTKDNKNFCKQVIIPEEELDKWMEVEEV